MDRKAEKLPKAPILPQDGRAADKCENTYEFYRFQRHINQSGWKQIKEIAGEYGVTVSAVLIGIYAEVISKWSSNKHFTLNLPIQNRPTMGNNINSIVGDFTAVNLLEVNVTQNMSFIERVKEITERLMEDLEHNSFSGVEVLRELSKVSEEKEVLMPIVFTGVLKTDGTAGTIEYGFSHTPQVWIDCQIVDELDSEDQEKGLMISWDARKGAIKESIVTEMFEVFIETIRILGTKHSEEWKNPLEIVVPSASQKKVICEQNKNVTKQSLIQQRFVEYAQKNSKRTAVIDALEKVTYRIEIAEIEAALMKIPQVENCCVVYHRNEGTGNLVAFIKERDKLKTILDMVECDEEKMGINAIDQFNECLEKAVCSSVYKQMSSIFNGKAALSKEEIISNIDVQPQYEVLLNRWLELLIVHGYLQDRNGKYELNKTEDNAAKYWEELRTIPYTNIAPDVVSEYIQNHAENICELLGGRINPLIFLFPEGKTTTAEALYGETAIARYLNGIIADVVKRYAVEFKQISILEVGGGIGATTKQILGKMEGLAYEYLFTDVSNFFLNNIRQQYPQVKTELLNLDDWDPSKFGEFHVIIAAGVLNNTKNILETVNKLKHMLRDEGILLVTEPLEEHIEITVSQAFMMPKHSDVRCMTGHCF